MDAVDAKLMAQEAAKPASATLSLVREDSELSECGEVTPRRRPPLVHVIGDRSHSMETLLSASHLQLSQSPVACEAAGVSSGGAAVVSSDTLDLLGAEEAVGADHQDDEHQHEPADRGEAGAEEPQYLSRLVALVGRDDGLEDADQQTAHDRTAERVQATDDDRRQRLEGHDERLHRGS